MNALELFLAAMVIFIVLAIGSCHKIADYNFCSNHFKNETWSCMWSNRYRAVDQ